MKLLKSASSVEDGDILVEVTPELSLVYADFRLHPVLNTVLPTALSVAPVKSPKTLVGP